jgi:hypothetical protein
MIRLAAPAVALALLTGILLSAQDNGTKKKGPTRPDGTWTRSEGGVKVTFEFKKHYLTCSLAEGDKKIKCTADYGVTKDGVLFGRIRKVEKKGFEEGPKEGVLFSFRFALKDGTMTISDLNAPGNGDAKRIVEGDYKGGASKTDSKASETK